MIQLTALTYSTPVCQCLSSAAELRKARSNSKIAVPRPSATVFGIVHVTPEYSDWLRGGGKDPPKV